MELVERASALLRHDGTWGLAAIVRTGFLIGFLSQQRPHFLALALPIEIQRFKAGAEVKQLQVGVQQQHVQAQLAAVVVFQLGGQAGARLGHKT